MAKNEILTLWIAFGMTVSAFSLSLTDLFRTQLTLAWKWTRRRFLDVGRAGFVVVSAFCGVLALIASLVPALYRSGSVLGSSLVARAVVAFGALPWALVVVYIPFRAAFGLVIGSIETKDWDIVAFAKEALFIAFFLAAPLLVPLFCGIYRANQGYWLPLAAVALVSTGWLLLICLLYGLVLIGQLISRAAKRDWGVHLAALLAGLLASLLKLLVSLGVMAEV